VCATEMAVKGVIMGSLGNPLAIPLIVLLPASKPKCSPMALTTPTIGICSGDQSSSKHYGCLTAPSGALPSAVTPIFQGVRVEHVLGPVGSISEHGTALVRQRSLLL